MNNENPVNTYIVRIYHLAGNKSRAILGTSEKIGIKGKKAFTNLNELWEILSSSKGFKNQRKMDSKKKSLEEGHKERR